MKLRRLNWLDYLILSAILAAIAGLFGAWYIYYWPQVYKFSCQIDRTKPAEGCHFILTGNNFVAPIQAYIMFPAMVEQSLLHVQLKKAELGGTPFVSFYQGKKLVGFYRIEDTNALMALIARSGFAILTPDRLSLKFTCQVQFGQGISCKEER